jgi:hypothetical protein
MNKSIMMPCALALFACGSGVGSATFNGTVRGQSMHPADAVSAPSGVGWLIISSVGGICAKMAARQEPRSWATLSVQLMDSQPIAPYAVPPASTGTFTIVPGNFAGQLPPHSATAGFNVTDVFCHNVAGGSAVSGTVTLTSNNGGAYSGSFDLTFDSGDHVTGAFNADHCAGIETFLAAAGNNTLSCG